MGRCHPIELRERVVACVEHSQTHRATAERFDVSVKFVNDMGKLKRETGVKGHCASVGRWLHLRDITVPSCDIHA